MKKALNLLLAGSLGLLALASCKKNDVVIKTNGGTAGKLTASSNSLVLDKSKVSDTTTAAVTFTSTPPAYNFKAAVTATLEVDSAGDNWKKPSSTTISTTSYTQSFSTPAFNAILSRLNLKANVASNVNVRIKYALSTTEYVYSNVVSMSVTPFNLTSWLYVTGVFSGWVNPGAAEDSLISVTGNGVYTGIINFTNANGNGDNEFLVLPVKGSWTHKYATNDAQGTTSSTVAYDGPNNFYAPAATGYYIVTIDVNKNTIAFQLADYYSIIGSAAPGVAWNTDTFLKFVNDGNNNWVGLGIPMTVGEYKFRQDGQWSNSWGPSATAGSVTTTGATGDGNIQLTTAGTYNFTLNMPPTSYGSAAVVTTTYTAVKQ